MELFMLDYWEPFNCVQIIPILVCKKKKKNSSDSFKNKIPNS